MITPYPYQVMAIDSLEHVLRTEQIAIANCDVGLGKTIMALDLVRRYAPPAVGVLAPKIVLSNWRRTADEMNVRLDFCANPELVRTGNRPDIVQTADKKLYKFNVPEGSVIIYDELHRYGAPESQLAYLLFGAKASKCKVIGLTGTLGESPLKFRAILSLCNQVPWKDFYRWAMEHGCYRDHNINGSPWRFQRGSKAREFMQQLHGLLFPRFGVRLSTADVPDYPECEVQAQLFDLDLAQQIKVNDIYEHLRADIKSPEKARTDLVRLLRYRQQVQYEKVPLFVDLATELIEEGKSVAVFFDFREPLHLFAVAMRKVLGYDIPIIEGDQDASIRDQNIARFQSNDARCIGLISQAGGVGISIGDETGLAPRVGLHNVPIDGITAHQACGRIHRATNKSKALNIFCLLAGVKVEETIYKMLRSKLSNLAAVQGDDITRSLFT